MPTLANYVLYDNERRYMRVFWAVLLMMPVKTELQGKGEGRVLKPILREI